MIFKVKIVQFLGFLGQMIIIIITYATEYDFEAFPGEFRVTVGRRFHLFRFGPVPRRSPGFAFAFRFGAARPQTLSFRIA